MSNFPAGREALRQHAAEAIRRALSDLTGLEIDAGDPRPMELVEVLERYQLPPSTAITWIHASGRDGEISGPRFARAAAAMLGGHEARRGDPGMCPSCGNPARAIGAYAVCTSGRCTPRLLPAA